ncbi:MAG: hypothetical protein IJ491_10100 [Clostridia bacterium]|nr:hypothetical protein [Clostridia bacterium]
MIKRNPDSFDLFHDEAQTEAQSFCDFFDERSKSISHENRFQSQASDFEKTRNLTKTEENQS